jgi:hypothetical protein
LSAPQVRRVPQLARDTIDEYAATMSVTPTTDSSTATPCAASPTCGCRPASEARARRSGAPAGEIPDYPAIDEDELDRLKARLEELVRKAAGRL